MTLDASVRKKRKSKRRRSNGLDTSIGYREFDDRSMLLDAQRKQGDVRGVPQRIEGIPRALMCFGREIHSNDAASAREEVMDWRIFLTVIGTGLGVVSLVYQIMRNFKADVNKSLERSDERFDKMERRFEMMDRRFEMIDQRLFLLCMGKSLPDILKAEREQGDSGFRPH